MELKAWWCEVSCLNKTIIEITDSVFINPTDVSSMEFGDYGNYYGSNYGTVITMKSGRKIFVKFAKPNEILKKIEDSQHGGGK